MPRLSLLPTACLLAALAVAGCSPTSTAKTIAATGTALVAAQGVALQYVTLPACPGTASTLANGRLCEQPAITVKIKKASADATAAYDAAAANPTDATSAAAAAALAALTALLPVTVN